MAEYGRSGDLGIHLLIGRWRCGSIDRLGPFRWIGLNCDAGPAPIGPEGVALLLLELIYCLHGIVHRTLFLYDIEFH
jgi:hypothetical protein